MNAAKPHLDDSEFRPEGWFPDQSSGQMAEGMLANFFWRIYKVLTGKRMQEGEMLSDGLGDEILVDVLCMCQILWAGGERKLSGEEWGKYLELRERINGGNRLEFEKLVDYFSPLFSTDYDPSFNFNSPTRFILVPDILNYRPIMRRCDLEDYILVLEQGPNSITHRYLTAVKNRVTNSGFFQSLPGEDECFIRLVSEEELEHEFERELRKDPELYAKLLGNPERREQKAVSLVIGIERRSLEQRLEIIEELHT